uniref:Uncharacterized protein n=1 Tax=Arundo donax TaxID=35708 RepID=A0A0A9CIX4_ARUDO
MVPKSATKCVVNKGKQMTLRSDSDHD